MSVSDHNNEEYDLLKQQFTGKEHAAVTSIINNVARVSSYHTAPFIAVRTSPPYERPWLLCVDDVVVKASFIFGIPPLQGPTGAKLFPQRVCCSDPHCLPAYTTNKSVCLTEQI